MEAALDGNSASATAASPATFAEAYASADSSSAGTPDQSPTPAAAVSPSADAEGSPQQADERSPFIPRTRFDEVVTARKQAEEQLAAWKEFEWVKQLPASDFKAVVDRLVRTKGDPIAVITELINETAAHPTYGPQLQALVAQRGQPVAAPKPPDTSGIVVDLGNGQQIALNDLKASWLAEIRQEFAPKLQTVEEIAREREELRLKADADKFATGTLGKLEKLPGFSDHKQAIGEWLAAHPPRDAHGRFIDTDKYPDALKAATYEAYLEVVLPTLGAKAQSALLDNLQQKAAASTSVNPGTAAASAPTNYTSFSQLPDYRGR